MYNYYGPSNLYGSQASYAPPQGTLPYPHQGLARSITKLGVLFRRPSDMSWHKEFWPCLINTDSIANWPSAKYPVILYTSTDHDNGVGGIWARVYEKALGPITDSNAWHEWEAISNRPEFDHISKKTNPIFTGRNMQTETPTVINHEGTLFLYFHEDYSAGSLTHDAQTTFYCTGTNGIDFSDIQNSNLRYERSELLGDGHSGYLLAGDNPFDEIPYTYIGVILHGGSTVQFNPGRYIVGSNDLVTWERVKYYRRNIADLQPFNYLGQSGSQYPLDNVHQARKEGQYYRIIGRYLPQPAGTGATMRRPCELLVDHEFRPVAPPNFYYEPGSSGEYDYDQAMTPFEFAYEGRVYLFTASVDTDGDSSIGIAEVRDVPHTWDLFYPYTKESVLVSSVTTSVAAPNATYSHSTSVKTVTDVQMTEVVVPQDKSSSTVEFTGTIDLSADDITLIEFERIGKDSDARQTIQFGIKDASGNNLLSIYFQARSTGTSSTSDMSLQAIKVVGGTSDTITYGNHRVGQANVDGDEYATAKHDLGIRVTPFENRFSVMAGSSALVHIDITGFDFNADFTAFITAQITESAPTQDESFSFHAVTVRQFSTQYVEQLQAPSIQTSVTGDSVTITADPVDGAQGYKYFLNGIESDSGEFFNLPSGAEFDAYAKAIGPNGLSNASTFQTLTTIGPSSFQSIEVQFAIESEVLPVDQRIVFETVETSLGIETEIAPVTTEIETVSGAVELSLEVEPNTTSVQQAISPVTTELNIGVVSVPVTANLGLVVPATELLSQSDLLVAAQVIQLNPIETESYIEVPLTSLDTASALVTVTTESLVEAQVLEAGQEIQLFAVSSESLVESETLNLSGDLLLVAVAVESRLESETGIPGYQQDIDAVAVESPIHVETLILDGAIDLNVVTSESLIETPTSTVDTLSDISAVVSETLLQTETLNLGALITLNAVETESLLNINIIEIIQQNLDTGDSTIQPITTLTRFVLAPKTRIYKLTMK